MHQIELVERPPRADYTVAEVAAILRCSQTTVRELLRSGELRSYRVGRNVRVRPEWLDEFRERQ